MRNKKKPKSGQRLENHWSPLTSRESQSLNDPHLTTSPLAATCAKKISVTIFCSLVLVDGFCSPVQGNGFCTPVLSIRLAACSLDLIWKIVILSVEICIGLKVLKNWGLHPVNEIATIAEVFKQFAEQQMEGWSSFVFPNELHE